MLSLFFFFFFLMIRRPPRSTLFPYTTLFRSLWVYAPISYFQEKRGSFGTIGEVGDAASCQDRKSTRLNSSHQIISYAVFCLKKKNNTNVLYASEIVFLLNFY